MTLVHGHQFLSKIDMSDAVAPCLADDIAISSNIVAEILIRKLDEATKEILRKRAERRGKSLEADLRDTLERLAREEAAPDDAAPFGDWLVSISRPGADLDAALDLLRAAPVRAAPLE